MPRHRNPRTRVSKPSSHDNLDADTGVLIRLLYEDLVEVEALAVTADEDAQRHANNNDVFALAV